MAAMGVRIMLVWQKHHLQPMCMVTSSSTISVISVTAAIASVNLKFKGESFIKNITM